MSSYRQRAPPHATILTAAPKRISVAASDRLSDVLDRDPDAPAQVPLPASPPPRSTHSQRSPGKRSFRGSALGDSPQEAEEEEEEEEHGMEKAPPPYTKRPGRGVFGTIPEDRPVVVPPAPITKNERHPAFRRPSRWEASTERLRRRGGWWRVLLLVLLALVVLGLALGLGLGLTVGKRTHTRAREPPAATGFPVGLWTFDVVLETQDASCSANAATWSCFPYATYAQSPSASRFAFNWVINTMATDAAHLNESLTIASTPDAFSLDFGPTPLTLLDADTPSERYAFDLPLAKQVQPSAPLASDNARTVCNFNASTLSGALYTRANAAARPAARPVGSPDSPQDWPGTLFAAQISPSGAGTPDCHRVTDGSLVPVPTGTKDCECAWVSGNGTAAG